MGTSVTIGIHTEPAARLATFCELVRTIPCRTPPILELKESDHSMSMRRKITLEEVTQPGVFSEKLAITAELPCNLGAGLPVDVAVFGREYGRGFNARDKGSVSVGAPLSSLVRNQRGGADDPAVELFRLACQPSAVRHAEMFYELGIPSQLGCVMVFHRDVREFGIDFQRAFDKHHNVAWALESLEPHLGRSQQRPTTSPHAYFEQFRHGKRFLEYLESLTAEAIAQILSTHPDELLVALEVVGSAPESEAMFQQLSDGAGVLRCARLRNDPLSCLWLAYRELALLLGQK